MVCAALELVLLTFAGLWSVGPIGVCGVHSDDLLNLYDRMGEPMFTPKGEDNCFYSFPEEWLSDRYKSMGAGFLEGFAQKAKRKIAVKKIDLSDLSSFRGLDHSRGFSAFIPEHSRMASELIQIFMNMPDLEDFLAAAVYARSRVNPYLFVHAFSVALLHRNDTSSIRIPSEVGTFPSHYFDKSVLSNAVAECAIVTNPQHRNPIRVPPTANDTEPEHAIAYFREDIGVNSHHWHWHLTNPTGFPPRTGGPAAVLRVVDKDRRGELFYYMHAQILARYNFERYCNGMSRVRALNLSDIIPEGYFSKLDLPLASKTFPGRKSNSTLSDINRADENMHYTIRDLETWEARLTVAARKHRYVTPDGKEKPLSIDMLGNMAESTILSPNRDFYGNLHNLGHTAICYAHDPDGRHLESFGVMGLTSTAVRDPIFYRWHRNINQIFATYKNRLQPYSEITLNFPGVKVEEIGVWTDGAARPGVFETYMQEDDIDLSRGLDFTERGAVYVRVTHLNHRPFRYNIKIANVLGRQVEGFVRIFIAPKFDEKGRALRFDKQRKLMVELDRFPAILEPGSNSVSRLSTESSVTISDERSFRTLNAADAADPAAQEALNACGCGWPQHMLIPKGTKEGLHAQLFLMVTDYAQDKVEQPTGGGGLCAKGWTYCGIRGRKYPDARAMYFPFDRRGRQGVRSLSDFLTPNMVVQDVLIQFDDDVLPPKYLNAQRQQKEYTPHRN